MAPTSLSVQQRIEFRKWYQSHTLKPSQKTAIAWARQTFGAELKQHTVSRYLAKKQDVLDTLDLKKLQLSDRYRYREAQWPILEDILQKWQVNMEIRVFFMIRRVGIG